MKKEIIDLRVTYAEGVGMNCVLLKARPVAGRLPECQPGQFAQLRVDAPGAFLRRPISIHDVEGDEISFLVQIVGEGTRWIGGLKPDDVLNAVLPLGKGFTIGGERRVESEGRMHANRTLLIGGGVGVAPLLFLGKRLKEHGIRPTFLLGARTKDLLLRLDAFRNVGEVLVTTEDGSMGEKGFVTQHPILQSSILNPQFSILNPQFSILNPQSSIPNSQSSILNPQFSILYVCGPMPMMKAVARLARERGIPCEVSLENRMACGVGACLCCVEEMADGHNRCVCTEGPVFDTKQLNWE